MRGFILLPETGKDRMMMTSDIVMAYSAKLSHITDDATGKEVLTRCGRRLKNFQVGYPGEKDCSKCGSEDDFEAVWEAKRQKRLETQQKREIENAERRARTEARLALHRESMRELADILDGWGAVVEMEEFPAGGKIEFRKNGLKFKVSGNIL